MFSKQRRALRRQWAILLLIILIQVGGGSSAQDESTIITVGNAAQVVQIERLGNGAVRQIVFAPDGSRVALATTLGVWVIIPQWGQAGSNDAQLLPGQNGTTSTTFSPDDNWIAGGGDDGSILVWDTASTDMVARLENHLYGIGALAWSNDGMRVASGDASGIIRIWDTMIWSEAQVYMHEGSIHALAFDPSGQTLHAETSLESITLNLETRAIQILRGVLESYVRPPFAVYQDKQAWVDQGMLHITQSGREVYAQTGFYESLESVLFRPDGQVAARAGHTAWVWVEGDGVTLSDPDMPVLSPDGTREARFGNDGVIRLIDTVSGSEIAAFYGHIRAVTAVAFSPDGSLMVSSSNDGTIRIWDASAIEDDQSLATLSGHNSGVSDVSFNADGSIIASSGYDGTVRLWAVR